MSYAVWLGPLSVVCPALHFLLLCVFLCLCVCLCITTAQPAASRSCIVHLCCAQLLFWALPTRACQSAEPLSFAFFCVLTCKLIIIEDATNAAARVHCVLDVEAHTTGVAISCLACLPLSLLSLFPT